MSPSYGYRLMADGVHLEERRDEQSVIAEVRRLEAQGLSLRGICERLCRAGLGPRSGAWHPQKVARILCRGDALGGSRVDACGDAAPASG